MNRTLIALSCCLLALPSGRVVADESHTLSRSEFQKGYRSALKDQLHEFARRSRDHKTLEAFLKSENYEHSDKTAGFLEKTKNMKVPTVLTTTSGIEVFASTQTIKIEPTDQLFNLKMNGKTIEMKPTLNLNEIQERLDKALGKSKSSRYGWLLPKAHASGEVEAHLLAVAATFMTGFYGIGYAIGCAGAVGQRKPQVSTAQACKEGGSKFGKMIIENPFAPVAAALAGSAQETDLVSELLRKGKFECDGRNGSFSYFEVALTKEKKVFKFDALTDSFVIFESERTTEARTATTADLLKSLRSARIPLSATERDSLSSAASEELRIKKELCVAGTTTYAYHWDQGKIETLIKSTAPQQGQSTTK